MNAYGRDMMETKHRANSQVVRLAFGTTPEDSLAEVVATVA
jgi:hypothetical protein